MVLSVNDFMFNFSPFSSKKDILIIPKEVRSTSVADPSGPDFINLNLYKLSKGETDTVNFPEPKAITSELPVVDLFSLGIMILLNTVVT